MPEKVLVFSRFPKTLMQRIGEKFELLDAGGKPPNEMFSAEQRLQWIEDIYKHEPKVSGGVYEGLTIDFCKKINAQFILRGIRYVSDFEYEKTIADANRAMDPSIETIFLTGEPKYTSVASTIVRDILRNRGDASPFLPYVVIQSLKKS